MLSKLSSRILKSATIDKSKNVSQSTEVSLLLHYSLIQPYSYVKHNKLVASEYTDSGIIIDSYYIHTYVDTRDGNIATNVGHLFQITLPKSIFEYAISLRPDVQDSLKNTIQEHIRTPLLILVSIAYTWGILVELLQPFAAYLGVSATLLIVLLFILVITIYIAGVQLYMHNQYIRFENITFEKYFDVSCYKKLYAREFLTPRRLEVIASRLKSLNHPNNAGHSIVFSQNKIYVYVSYLGEAGRGIAKTSIQEVFKNDRKTARTLIDKLHIEHLLQ